MYIYNKVQNYNIRHHLYAPTSSIHTPTDVISLETDDLDNQLQCVNDLISETHRQRNLMLEGGARVEKMTFFYNNSFNDSIYEQVPQTLKFLETIKSWRTTTKPGLYL